MLVYLVTPAVFLDRHRRFSAMNDKMSQAEIMIFKDSDVLNLYFHDIDKCYTTQILDDGSDKNKVYFMNFMHKVPVLQKPYSPAEVQYVPVENKLLQ